MECFIKLQWSDLFPHSFDIGAPFYCLRFQNKMCHTQLGRLGVDETWASLSNKTTTEIRIWIDNYILMKPLDAITHPRPNFNGAKPLSESMLGIVNWILRNKLQWNFNRNSYIFVQKNALESVFCELASILSRPQWVKLCVPYHVIFEIADSCVQGYLNDFNLKFGVTNHG